MSHKVQPGQEVVILTVRIAVPADALSYNVADEMSALLSEHGTENPESCILDWRYAETVLEVTAPDAPKVYEGEIFEQLNGFQVSRREYFG